MFFVHKSSHLLHNTHLLINCPRRYCKVDKIQYTYNINDFDNEVSSNYTNSNPSLPYSKNYVNEKIVESCTEFDCLGNSCSHQFPHLSFSLFPPLIIAL